MITMGLDLSLTSTGYSILGKTGSISVKSKGPERLMDIREDVRNLLHANGIEAVFVEGYAFSARNSQSHKIGELGGVIRLLMFEMNIPYVEIPPTSRAKFATGKGNAGKTEVISSISARTGITWLGSSADDECDAWILEEMGGTFLGNPKYEWPKSHLDSLKSVDWSSLQKGDSK
jgi:crossover junction endodeoxyribonuclease RuvC